MNKTPVFQETERLLDYKGLITEMIQDMDESDNSFLIQIYTIIRRHTIIMKKGEKR